jgi:hypothetical protein
MNVLTIPRTAIQTSLALVRAPFVVATSLLPGGVAGPRGRARRAIDSADATVRGAAATVMFDPTLHNEARERKMSVLDDAATARRKRKTARQIERTAAQAYERHRVVAHRRKQVDATVRALAERPKADRPVSPL